MKKQSQWVNPKFRIYICTYFLSFFHSSGTTFQRGRDKLIRAEINLCDELEESGMDPTYILILYLYVFMFMLENGLYIYVNEILRLVALLFVTAQASK